MQENTTTLQPLLTKKDVAEMLGVTTRTINNMMKERTIPFIRIGCGGKKKKIIRFDRDQVMAVMQKFEIPAEDPEHFEGGVGHVR